MPSCAGLKLEVEDVQTRLVRICIWREALDRLVGTSPSAWTARCRLRIGQTRIWSNTSCRCRRHRIRTGLACLLRSKGSCKISIFQHLRLWGKAARARRRRIAIVCPMGYGLGPTSLSSSSSVGSAKFFEMACHDGSPSTNDFGKSSIPASFRSPRIVYTYSTALSTVSYIITTMHRVL